MNPNDLHALLRIEALRRERWHHPAERHRREMRGRRRRVGGLQRRNTA